MKTIHHALFLSPVLFVLGCAITGDDPPESTAEAEGALSPTLIPLPMPSDGPTLPPRVTSSDPASAAPTVLGHACNVLGGDGSTQGVHCADLAFVTNSTGWEMWGVGEALCQTISGGVEKQCAGIRQNVGLYNPSGQLAGAQHNCGRFGGSACPATVRFQNSSGHATLPFPPAGFCYEIWAAMTNEQIVLPVSARTVGPSPNVGTAHFDFCTM
jgi:hypothetical protein